MPRAGTWIAGGIVALAALLVWRKRATAAVARPNGKPRAKPAGKRPAAKPPAKPPAKPSAKPQPPALPSRAPIAGSNDLACHAAKIAFRAIQAATARANKPPRPLPESTRRALSPLFPKLDLRRVRYLPDATLPANELAKLGIPGAAKSIKAMTFGYDIYIRGPADMKLLVHELTHVDQVRRLGGESKFACAYGTGVVAGDGTYAGNPLEAEAFRFAEAGGAWLRATGANA